MTEEKVRETREAYVTELQVPLYYDRFLDERDRRVAAELHELRSIVEINAHRIEELRMDLLRGLAAAQDERLRGFEEARDERVRGFEEAQGEYLRGFEEAQEERLHGFKEMRGEYLRGFEEARDERVRGFEEARDERVRGFGEAQGEYLRGFEEARDERVRGFEEVRECLNRLERKADVNFRWTIGLLMPLVIGILVIIVRSFLGLP